MLEILERKPVLFLIMDEGCNLDCDYCFQKRQRRQLRQGNRLMNSAVVETAIAKWLELSRSRKELSVVFYGGEPFLNPEGILAGLKFLKEVFGIEQFIPETTIVTNGTLITAASDELLDLIRVMGTIIAVSVDGSQSNHDHFRKYPNGAGSFKETMRGLAILKARKAQISLSAALTPTNFNQADGLLEIAANFGVKSISASPLIGEGFRLIQEGATLEEYATEAVKASFEYFRKASELGIRESWTGRIKAVLAGGPLSLDCMAYGSQLVVWPNGDIGICHAMREVLVGSIFSDLAEISKRQKILACQWLPRLPLFLQECSDCEAKKICGGGCAYSALALNGDLMTKDRAVCEYVKQAYKLIVSRKRRGQ